MTSHHIPDGKLLSPFPQNLIEEPFLQKQRLWSEKAYSPCPLKMDIGIESDLTKTVDFYGKLKNRKDKTRENMSERKDDNLMNFDHEWKKAKTERDKGNSEEVNKQTKPSSKLIDNGQERQAKDAVSESSTGVKSFASYRESKLDKVPSDYLSHEGEHLPKDFCSPYEPRKEAESNLSKSRRIEKPAPTSSHDSMTEPAGTCLQSREVIKEASSFETGIPERRQSEVNMEHGEGKKKFSMKGSSTMFEEKTNMNHDTKKSMLKNSKPGKSVLVPVDMSVTSKETPKDASEILKRSKESSKEAHASASSSKEKGKESFKEARKSSGKDKHVKEKATRDSSRHSLNMEPTKEVVNNPKSVSKELQQSEVIKLQKVETIEPKKKDKLKDRIKSEFPTKEYSRLYNDPLSQDAIKSAEPSFQTPLYNQLDASEQLHEPGALPPSVAVITEDWVMCDKCDEWRLLPPGLGADVLPKTWSCKMMDWL
jgi:hypothetical protein